MRRSVLTLLAILVLAASLSAQTPTSVRLSSGTCPGTGCAVINTNGNATIGLHVVGTFDGTVAFQQSNDGEHWIALTLYNATAPSTPVTNTLSAGLFTGSIAGAKYIRVAFVEYASGAATIYPVKTMARGAGPPTSGIGGAAEWSSSSTYATGATVYDRGGIWQATGSNTNSQPISGNTNWTLVGGLPYVDVVLDAPAIRTAFSAPVLALDAPGEGKAVWPIRSYSIYTPADGSNHFSANIGINLVVGTLTDAAVATAFNGSVATSRYVETGVDVNDAAVLGVVNSALYVKGVADRTGGTGTFQVRIHYLIIDGLIQPVFFAITGIDQTLKLVTIDGDASALTGAISIIDSTGNDGTYTIVSASFVASASEAITAVNQGAKRFTVAGDHVADYPAGTPLTVSGSTGNDGSYTIASVTLSAGNTLIVVNEAISDGTPDGTASHNDETAIVVSEALPDSTIDGWIRQ